MDPVVVPAPAPPFSEEQLAWLQAATGRPLVIPTVSDGVPHASGGTLPPLSATPTTPAMPGEQEIGVVTIAGNQLSLPYSTSPPSPPHSWGGHRAQGHARASRGSESVANPRE